MQPSTIVAETGEAEVAVTGEAAETVEAEPAAVVVHRVVVTSTGVKDTPLIPQKVVVNAIMSTGTKLFTVRNPCHVHGCRRSSPPTSEVPASLIKKKFIITTKCFLA